MRQRHRPATIRDVAALAGCSITTVSQVLNDVPGTRINSATRERVKSAAQELTYSPNRLAQARRTGRTNILGFVSDAVGTTPYAGRMLLGAQDAAAGGGSLLMMMNAGLDVELTAREVKSFKDFRVDGVIFAADYHRVVDMPPTLVGIPAVLANARTLDRKISSTVPDETGGTKTVMAQLIAAGHRRIGFLKEISDIPATSLRLDGYRKALREAQIRYRPDLVASEPSNTQGGYRAAVRLLNRRDRPTALFCFNDRMAMGAYQAAAEAGMRIPDDLSVTGFDNQDDIAGGLRPGLTTAELPHYDMGHWAASTLLDLIAGDSPRPATHTILPCQLIRRGSVGPPI